jgi:hypothetical protein
MMRGEHPMKKSFSLLLLGLVMLAGTGIAQAADVAQTNTQNKVAPTPIVVADAQKPETVVSQAQGRLVLTDDQMNGVTAGHYLGYLHYGGSWYWSYFWANWKYSCCYLHY